MEKVKAALGNIRSPPSGEAIVAPPFRLPAAADGQIHRAEHDDHEQSDRRKAISRPPTRWEKPAISSFAPDLRRGLADGRSWSLFIVFEIGWAAGPGDQAARPGLPHRHRLGPQYAKSTASSRISGERSTVPCWPLIIGTVLGLAVAIFLSERFLSLLSYEILRLLGFHPLFWGKLPDQPGMLLKNLIELLAAIPSVVYGLWGIFVIIPLMAGVQLAALSIWAGSRGSITSYRPGMLPGGLGAGDYYPPDDFGDQLRCAGGVPPKLREAAYGWGPRAGSPPGGDPSHGPDRHLRRRDLGLRPCRGRDHGPGHADRERQLISWSLFSPANTLAALLANNFPRPSRNMVPVLMYAAWC